MEDIYGSELEPTTFGLHGLALNNTNPGVLDLRCKDSATSYF